MRMLATRWTAGAAGLALLALTACASKPETARMPERSLDELYAQADEVNETADPYRLGTGDAVGAQTYGIYVRGVKVERAPGSAPTAGSRANADREDR